MPFLGGEELDLRPILLGPIRPPRILREENRSIRAVFGHIGLLSRDEALHLVWIIAQPMGSKVIGTP